MVKHKRLLLYVAVENLMLLQAESRHKFLRTVVRVTTEFAQSTIVVATYRVGLIIKKINQSFKDFFPFFISQKPFSASFKLIS